MARSKTRSALEIDGKELTLDRLRAFESRRPRVTLAAAARKRMQGSRDAVRRAIDRGDVSYGINTGFGAFANKVIPAANTRKLQLNLIRSHACGTGQPLPEPIVRRMLLLKAHSLAAGHSGARPLAAEMLLALLNSDVLPIVPSQGSVGASGDLAPLAHVALALAGEGEAMHDGKRLSGREVLDAVGLEPLGLEAKEGLALLNGTQLSLALALEGLFQAEHLLDASIVAGALTVEGLAGSHVPFDARIQEASRLPGQVKVGERFRRLLTESEIRRSHADCERVQDPYAVRCMPQVFGAVEHTLEHARAVLGAAVNGVSDNPLIFGDDILSGGNFHAEPVGFVSDFLAIAVAELASIAERRIDLLDRRVNPNLNMFMAAEPGLESGFMMAHVTAAALVSENKTYAHPASVDSLPTSAGQEDHVSMAPWAGRKLLAVCANTATVLGIELLAAAQAIDAMRPLTTTPELQRVHALVRERVPYRAHDHRLDRDIEALAALVREGTLSSFIA
ncbi:MAG TPA: histidine ammonia-lyase [Steroidobacteraceae bacterium]|nr:histidine ammonia-lyase [Steroidobacteraceae bacterium]HQR49358.1 histidine ammonia-lyase [Steroidobacteraceae bacterium]